jgi:hypothetical protein
MIQLEELEKQKRGPKKDSPVTATYCVDIKVISQLEEMTKIEERIKSLEGEEQIINGQILDEDGLLDKIQLSFSKL